jgi:heme exporter protein D
MSSIVWLALTVSFVVLVVLTGHTPRGGKPVARTGLMKAARSVLLGGILVCGALGVWGALHR